MSTSQGWLRATSAAFLVLIPLLAAAGLFCVAAYWGFGLARIGDASTHMLLADAPPVPGRQVYGLIAAGIPLLLWLYAMLRLFLLFLYFRRGEALVLRTVRELRAFALYLALTVIAGFALSGMARWAMGRFDDAPLWTHLGFSTTHAAVLFMAGIVYVASHIIEQGYGYRRETEEYV